MRSTSFHAGWHVRVDTDVLARSANIRRSCAEAWVTDAISGYAEPRAAATAALAASTPCSPQEIVELNLDDLSADCRSLQTAKGDFELDPAAAHLVRAQAVERRLEGASPGEPLFTYETDSGKGTSSIERLKERAVSNLLKKVERETGAMVSAPSHKAVTESARNWTRRSGVLVEELK